MNEDDLVICPIQIRPNLVIKVQLPRDLKKPEADKICRVVMAFIEEPVTNGNSTDAN